MNKKSIPFLINQSFNVIKHSLVESLFPQVSNCLFCGSPTQGGRLSAGLCPQCLLDWLQFRKNAAICPCCGSFESGQPCRGPCGGKGQIGKMGSLNGARAAVPYNGLYRQKVMAFKYNGRQDLALPMGFLMAKTWEEEWGQRLLSGSGLCLVPVPMHQAKERARGYNQSRLLAEVISCHLKLPVQELIWRPLAGQVQAGLNKRQRRQALAQVFQWAGTEVGNRTERAGGRSSSKIRGSAVILVDDVITTGATLESCGQLLRQQGFNPIWGLTFAGGSSADV